MNAHIWSTLFFNNQNWVFVRKFNQMTRTREVKKRPHTRHTSLGPQHKMSRISIVAFERAAERYVFRRRRFTRASGSWRNHRLVSLPRVYSNLFSVDGISSVCGNTMDLPLSKNLSVYVRHPAVPEEIASPSERLGYAQPTETTP